MNEMADISIHCQYLTELLTINIASFERYEMGAMSIRSLILSLQLYPMVGCHCRVMESI